MPFTPIGEENLDEKIAVRLTADEKQRLQDDAALAGISVSALVRRRYFGHPIVPRADLRAIAQLVKLGGLLKHVHKESGGVYRQETATAVMELAGLAAELRKQLAR